MKEIKISESTVKEVLSHFDSLDGIPPKNIGCLRLLTEEMFSMCHELLDKDTLDFSLTQAEHKYTLRVATKTRVDSHAREEFLSLSSSGKNDANKGIQGMLGGILEMLSLEGEPEMCHAAWSYGMSPAMENYSYLWSLAQYMETAPDEEVSQEWDGMEKSIIANFADDVSIGVRSGRLEMIVTKTF